uniref:Uncharacterized protein n=1 Tax=Anguilla anguilla TaxID=7936 RepID=A0A0E9PQF8_ANGAN
MCKCTPEYLVISLVAASPVSLIPPSPSVGPVHCNSFI